ncbi:MAG: hypothetical protein M1812_006299 [Candelaria pacifica]|nr:MAG: hypothetical protein M1812_006299 [Candelaria pacifica]
MAVVVAQTVPYTNPQLELDNPDRWHELLPLIRPTIHSVSSNGGHSVLIDRSSADSKNVRIAAIGSLGNSSSKFLSENGISAIAIEKTGSKSLSARDVGLALTANGVSLPNGLVVLRVAGERKMELHGSDVAEVEVKGELELDHVLSLLLAVDDKIKASFGEIIEFLKLFLKTVTSTTSKFDTQKTGANPSVVHAGSSASFESAKFAVEKDLIQVLRSHTAQEGPVVYSIHYADLNGLSRLENYLLAHEISTYVEEQNLPSHITSSTILDHGEAARGWAISICPVPKRVLAAQAKPSRTASERGSEVPAPMKTHITKASIQLTDKEVRQRIVLGCEMVIKAEPAITEYDTIVGDGDCGYTLRDGAQRVLSFIADVDLAKLPQSLSALIDELETNMGGTSGALYCIFLSALAQSLWDASSFADALVIAQDQLLKYTSARLGDRTMMDCLIPFVTTLKGVRNEHEALEEAKKGVEGTKNLEAKLGRSTYLDESATQGVPDPGAYGLLKLLEGLTLSS